jgi:hypothetical protein
VGSGERPADSGEQGAVGGLELGTWRLAAQDGELMMQHRDLQVLGGVAAGEQRERLDRATQREIGEFRQHRQEASGVGGRTATVLSRAGGQTRSSRLSFRIRRGKSSGSSLLTPVAKAQPLIVDRVGLVLTRLWCGGSIDCRLWCR